MVQDQNHSKTRFISFDRFVLIQGVVIDILLPVDVEKLLFQSFPVRRLNLQKLKKRVLCPTNLMNYLLPYLFPWVLAAAQELEDLAGNSMNIRAVAAAWLCSFSAIDLNKWNAESITREDNEPLVRGLF